MAGARDCSAVLPLWDDYEVLSLAQRARMADDALMADLLLQVTQGVTGGKKPRWIARTRIATWSLLLVRRLVTRSTKRSPR